MKFPNTQIREQVPLELAKFLKKIGYSQPCTAYYRYIDVPYINDGLNHTKDFKLIDINGFQAKFVCSAPLISEILTWLELGTNEIQLLDYIYTLDYIRKYQEHVDAFDENTVNEMSKNFDKYNDFLMNYSHKTITNPTTKDTNMIQVIEESQEELTKRLMKVPKKKLVEMLIQSNKHLDYHLKQQVPVADLNFQYRWDK
jgi:hypothetical protein